MTELRKCLDCEKDKPFTDFNLSVHGRGGRGAYCRECGSARARKWRETSPKAPRALRVAPGDYRPTPGKVSLPHLPCLARIDALLERT